MFPFPYKWNIRTSRIPFSVHSPNVSNVVCKELMRCGAVCSAYNNLNDLFVPMKNDGKYKMATSIRVPIRRAPFHLPSSSALPHTAIVSSSIYVSGSIVRVYGKWYKCARANEHLSTQPNLLCESAFGKSLRASLSRIHRAATTQFWLCAAD